MYHERSSRKDDLRKHSLLLVLYATLLCLREGSGSPGSLTVVVFSPREAVGGFTRVVRCLGPSHDRGAGCCMVVVGVGYGLAADVPLLCRCFFARSGVTLFRKFDRDV